MAKSNMPKPVRPRGRPKKNATPSPAHESEDDSSLNKGRKRKSTDNQEEPDENRSKRQRQGFAYLKPKTRQLPQAQVTKQWKALPEAAQQQVSTIVNAAKRSVAYSSRDINRAREAEMILDRLVRLIQQRLPRMPFPKNSKDHHFNLEKVIKRNVGKKLVRNKRPRTNSPQRQLESQLTPAIHSIELLKAAIDDENGALERDEEALAALVEAAKAREAQHKRLTKKVGPPSCFPTDVFPFC